MVLDKNLNSHFSETLMEYETRTIPEIIAHQLKQNQFIISQLVERLHANPPKFAMTIGRGSSDHACTFAKYLLETKLGLVTASAAPSTVSIYHANLKLQNALVIGISQSGKSPDICKIMEEARRNGALTVAIVNHIDSPLAKIVEYVLPLWAQEEKAVAATKSYIASLTALTQLTAIWTHDEKLIEALDQLPDILYKALKVDHLESALLELKNISHTLVIARGFGFPIAQEAALKCKETAVIQAEAFSGAEVLHGPFALIQKNHPFLLFLQNDATLQGNIELAKRIQNLGGKIILIAPEDLLTEEIRKLTDIIISLPKSIHAILDPIVVAEVFYLMAARLAVLRGFNPDAPKNLKKVTETI